GKLTGTVAYSDTDSELPPTMLTQPAGETQRDRSLRSMLQWERSLNGLGTLIARGAWIREHLHYRNQVASIDAPSRFDRFVGQVDLRRSKKSRALYVEAAGLRFFHDGVQNTNYQDGSARQSLGSAFTQISFFPHERLKSELVLRQELLDGQLAPWMAFWGTNYRALDFLRIRLGLNKNAHAPTLNDRFWVPGGNPDLLQEKSLGGELAFIFSRPDYGDWRWKVHVAGFLQSVDNWIQWVPTTSNFWVSENVRKVQASGIESIVEFETQPGEWDFYVRLSHTWTRSRNMEADSSLADIVGKQLIYVPEHRAAGRMGIGWKRFRLQYQHTFTGSRFLTRDNVDELPAFHVADLILEKRFSLNKNTLAVQAGIANIWDATYQNVVWRPMPGRNYYLRLEWEFLKR
ncbi:MAG: TonB-dependent receptor, partial [Bacteroidota bacterium]